MKEVFTLASNRGLNLSWSERRSMTDLMWEYWWNKQTTLFSLPCTNPCTASSGTWYQRCQHTAPHTPAPPGTLCCGWPGWSACAAGPSQSVERAKHIVIKTHVRMSVTSASVDLWKGKPQGIVKFNFLDDTCCSWYFELFACYSSYTGWQDGNSGSLSVLGRAEFKSKWKMAVCMIHTSEQVQFAVDHPLIKQ